MHLRLYAQDLFLGSVETGRGRVGTNDVQVVVFQPVDRAVGGTNSMEMDRSDASERDLLCWHG